MYFVNDEHINNFKLFSSYYGQLGYKPEYRANIYIAAIPELFKLIDTMELHGTEKAPLNTLMQYNSKTDSYVPSKKELKRPLRPLVEIGMSLYNGHQCSLDFDTSIEYGQVIVQAMELRYKL